MSPCQLLYVLLSFMVAIALSAGVSQWSKYNVCDRLLWGQLHLPLSISCCGEQEAFVVGCGGMYHLCNSSVCAHMEKMFTVCDPPYLRA